MLYIKVKYGHRKKEFETKLKPQTRMFLEVEDIGNSEVAQKPKKKVINQTRFKVLECMFPYYLKYANECKGWESKN